MNSSDSDETRAETGDAADEAPRCVDVVVGVLCREFSGEQRVLIARRKRDAVLGRCWEFPGGKVERGEALQRALQREFTEELAVSVRVGALLMRTEHRYPHAHVALHVFWCAHEHGEPQALEIDAFKWVAPQCLDDFTFPEANTPILARVVSELAAS